MRGSIILSAPTLHALERREKTQTRRLFAPPPAGTQAAWANGNTYLTVKGGLATGEIFYPSGEFVVNAARPGEKWFRCPYGGPGAVLRVREVWCAARAHDGKRPSEIPLGAAIHYLADGAKPAWAGRTRSPIFLPRWASRWELELTAIRLQRVQEISEADARAEGVQPCPYVDRHPNAELGGCLCHLLDEPRPYACSYAEAWDSLHGTTGPESWQGNPWVRALTFQPRRVSARRAA